MSIDKLATPSTANRVQDKINEIIAALGNSMGPSSGYVGAFDAESSWTEAAEGYSLTVSAADHGAGTAPMVDLWQKSGDSYLKSNGYPSTGWTVTVNSDGDVTVSVGAGGRFAGRIIIK